MDRHNLKKKMKELFIVKEENGSYNLFGKYTIIKDTYDNYRIAIFEEDIRLGFSSLKNAVTYCVFDKNNKQKDGQRVFDLDQSVSSLDFSIAQNTKLYNNADDERKNILSAKIVEAKFKKKQALKEIENYVNLSKYWQIKKFEENQQKTIEQ
jgi:hypothetical protein